MNSRECVACSGPLHLETRRGFSDNLHPVKVCEKCDGLHFEGTRTEGYDLLKFQNFHNIAIGKEIYFDFVLDGKRIHGWYDSHTMTPVQFG